MILVKVFGERTDVAAYLSYYAKEELKVLTEANDEELFFETVVSGFCLDGDLVEVNQIVVEVVMDKKYEADSLKIAEVINYYATYFANNVYVYFTIKEENQAFSFLKQEKKEFESEELKFEEDDCCHCMEGEECTCGDECHCHEGDCKCGEDCKCREGGECTCGDECHCHEEGHECKCGDGCKCHCEE